MMRDVVGTILIVGATIFLCIHLGPALFRAFATGEWSMPGVKYARRERPLMFWGAVLFYAGMLALAVSGSLVLISGWI
jgi:hypothetical protein